MNRPPIVTVLGHVDHGKTTLLDALRNTDVVSGESGGITQHTGASQIEYKGNKITFIDTPGHAAFSEMRSRGGKVADIVILVVAANDGVMPQTEEAISHAKAAGIPIIVAINKIDLPQANIQKAKNQLMKHEIVLEEFGGDVIGVEVSALQKTNLDRILDSIIALSEVRENEDSKEGELRGFVLEGRHDPKKGVSVNILLTSGILNEGDSIVIGGRLRGKVRSMQNSKGERIEQIEAGDPAEITGLKEVPEPGEIIETDTGKELKSVEKEAVQRDSLDTKEDLDVVIRADTQGTLEAIMASLNKLEYEGRKVNILLSGVGELKESDILLASVSNAIVVAFKVSIPSKVSDLAENHGLLVREYEIIYELVEELEGALEGMYEIEEEKVKGRAEIQKLFDLPSGDVIAGCEVTHGRLREGDSVSVREEVEAETEVFKSKIKNLKSGKESIETAGKNTECGVLLIGNYDKLRPGYFVEVL